MGKETVGVLVAAARAEAGLTLAKVAAALELSVPYIHDVEKDNRRLDPKHWRKLVRVLPTLTIRGLAVASVNTHKVTIDARDLSAKQQAALVASLVEAAEKT